jgi:hypothetical protein
MMQESSGGRDCGRGASGEYGCFQYMPSNWVDKSKEVLGYVAPQTRINEHYVTLVVVQRWLDIGYTVDEIALKWNHPAALVYGCSSGVNSEGVHWDSCEYQQSLLAHYHN